MDSIFVENETICDNCMAAAATNVLNFQSWVKKLLQCSLFYLKIFSVKLNGQRA